MAVAVVVSPAAGEVAAGVEPAVWQRQQQMRRLCFHFGIELCNVDMVNITAGRTIAEIRINKTTPRNAKTPIKE
ncbi:MAG: hypothetical protein U1E98_01730 [Moraxella osloensis]